MPTSNLRATLESADAASRVGSEALPQILLIDDDPLTIEYVKEALSSRPVKISSATNGLEGIEKCRTLRPDLVLLDLMLPEGDGVEIMSRIHEVQREARVLIMTAHYSTESAVRAIRAGAEDYLNKPIALDALRARIDRWLDEESQRRKAARLEAELLGTFQFEGIVGRSPAMLNLFAKVRRIAPHFSTALVTGETGTGKELVAKALHAWSQRPGPLAVCNCAAIVDTLFESELFGHVKGSFTGAMDDRKGLVESAQQGTLLLDEVGEMPLAVQAKLLRLLQSHEVRRVGENRSRTVDVRVVAATNRDLRAMVSEGTFREDLFYRLSMFQLRLPRLRDRKEDLPLLVQHFLTVFSQRYGKPELRLTHRAQTLIRRHSWPGNVRELENALSHACMLAEDEVVDSTDFPEYMLSPARGTQRAGGTLTMAELERQHAEEVLRRCDGNRVRAAEVLGISRATLYRLLAKSEAAER